VLNVKSGERVKNVGQIILAVTHGPRQPADLEPFLHPIAEELNELASGISGVKIAGRDGASQVHAYVLPFTTDMPGGDKLLNAKGHKAFFPGRFRVLFGVRVDKRYYYPPVNPYTKKRRFRIDGSEQTQMTAKSLAEDVENFEAARREGESMAAVDRLAVKTGIQGYSLIFVPSPEDKLRFPHLSYLW